jgi:hypothetical protein
LKLKAGKHTVVVKMVDNDDLKNKINNGKTVMKAVNYHYYYKTDVRGVNNKLND